MIDVLRKYFPLLDDKKIMAYKSLVPVYEEWNSKIKVVSRKDISNLFEHHILHSLAIAKVISFPEKAKVLDVGTGGGFPGIPLAIMFPEVDFTLIDSIGKKLTVANAALKMAGLENVETVHRNAIEEKGKYNFIVSRAVMNAANLTKMVVKNVSSQSIGTSRNSLVVLKGGDLSEELMDLERLRKSDKRLKKCVIKTFKISDSFQEEFFKEKYVVQVLF